jgi:predicted regulator of Ras-like GTPase activity (Roadblock/LC7/MglB family)
MAMTRAERNQHIERTLADLASLRGVTTAAIVDGDGFVTHIRRDFEVDADALGAAVQIMSTAATRAAEQANQDSNRLVLSENKDGMVLMAPLARGFVLVIVGDSTAMLGTIRYEVRETVPELSAIFGG